MGNLCCKRSGPPRAVLCFEPFDEIKDWPRGTAGVLTIFNSVWFELLLIPHDKTETALNFATRHYVDTSQSYIYPGHSILERWAHCDKTSESDLRLLLNSSGCKDWAVAHGGVALLPTLVDAGKYAHAEQILRVLSMEQLNSLTVRGTPLSKYVMCSPHLSAVMTARRAGGELPGELSQFRYDRSTQFFHPLCRWIPLPYTWWSSWAPPTPDMIQEFSASATAAAEPVSSQSGMDEHPVCYDIRTGAAPSLCRMLGDYFPYFNFDALDRSAPELCKGRPSYHISVLLRTIYRMRIHYSRQCAEVAFETLAHILPLEVLNSIVVEYIVYHPNTKSAFAPPAVN